MYKKIPEMTESEVNKVINHVILVNQPRNWDGDYDLTLTEINGKQVISIDINNTVYEMFHGEPVSQEITKTYNVVGFNFEAKRATYIKE